MPDNLSFLFIFISWVVLGWLWRVAIKKAQADKFYEDTPQLWLLGIYVWGDGLVLLPFWIISVYVLTYLSFINQIRFLLIFLGIRSAYEVIYWLLQQFGHQNYRPPFLRKIKWLDAHQAAILYQLFHSCVLVLTLLGLILTTTQVVITQ